MGEEKKGERRREDSQDIRGEEARGEKKSRSGKKRRREGL